MNARQAAERHISGGWAIVPVPPGEKGPRIGDWLNKTFTAEDVRPGDNLGLKCGAVSGHLVDIDLDAAEAVTLADQMLPPTRRIHGRPSKRRSHRWYRVEGAKTKRFEHVNGDVIVEIRGDGAQTIIPPSTHPSGEAVTWDEHSDVCTVPAGELRRAVALLAATVLMAKHWPADGSRNDCANAFAGFLANRGLTADQVSAIVENTARLASDEEAASRGKCARFGPCQRL